MHSSPSVFHITYINGPQTIGNGFCVSKYYYTFKQYILFLHSTYIVMYNNCIINYLYYDSIIMRCTVTFRDKVMYGLRILVEQNTDNMKIPV